MSYSEKLLKGSAIVFTAAVAAAIISYLLRLFIARNLSVADFGLLYSILAFVGLFSIFKDLGLGNTLVKFLAEFSGRGQEENIKPSIFVVGIIQIAAALALILPIIISSDYIAMTYFKTPEASFPLKLIAISFLVGTLMTTLQQASQGLGHVKLYSLVEPVRITSTFILAFFLIYAGVTGLSYAYVLAAAITAIFLGLRLKSTKTIKGGKIFSGKLAKKLLKFGFPVFIGGLSSLLLIYTDTVTLTVFRGVGDVGLYQAALPTSQLLWVLVSSLAAVLLPVMSEMWSKDQKTFVSAAVGLVSKFAFIIVVPLAMIMIAFSEDIIRILFGQAYIPAAMALQVLALNAVFYTLFVIFSTSLISVNKPFVNTKITAFISVLNLVLDVALVPHYGIVAAALATTVSYFIGAILTFYSLKKTVQIRMDISSLGKTFIGGVISLGIIFSVKSFIEFNLWAEVAASLAAGLGFYTIFILKTGGLKKDEMQFLSRLRIPMPKFVVRFLVRLAS